MKRLKYLLSILLLSFGFVACSGLYPEGNEGHIGEGGEDTTNTEFSFDATVIERGDRLLVTPEKDSSEIRSSDQISVWVVDEAEIVDLNQNSIEIDQLKEGDLVRITYDGLIAESYPAQITATRIEFVGRNLLLDGYLALIDDLYQVDPGLNQDISIIAIDTTGWKEITEVEKQIIFFIVEQKYGYEVKEGTFDELAEEGLIDKENLYFETGILIEITDIKYKEDGRTITCAIKKWRSGLGAIGANDVKAIYDGDSWNITKEGNWIS